MKWKHPPIIKIYEALGTVADGRVKIDQNKAKVFSSSGNKYYDVVFDKESRAIMSNDNGSYWRGYLGYPSIAYLMSVGEISYSNDVGNILKEIPWKNLNQDFKNDFDKTLKYIEYSVGKENSLKLAELAKKVDSELQSLGLKMLGKRIIPPEGY